MSLVRSRRTAASMTARVIGTPVDPGAANLVAECAVWAGIIPFFQPASGWREIGLPLAASLASLSLNPLVS